MVTTPSPTTTPNEGFPPARKLTSFIASSLLVLVFMDLATIRPRQHVAAAGLVGPIFPGAPSLVRIGAVAGIARIDLALRQVGDLATQHLSAHQRTGVARQIDRHSHHLDDRACRRRKAVAAHER